MIVHVLGSAAGGGFPQWNCACPNCRGVREGTLRARPRTQECVAISARGDRWYLLNCSPEIRAQIESFPVLRPKGRRHTPIAGILLTNGDLDHTLGLLCLREGQPLCVYATETVRRGFVEGNSLVRTLERFAGQLTWRRLDLDRELLLEDHEGRPELRVRAIAVPGKVPLHLEGGAAPSPLDNVGLLIEDLETGGTLAYVSAAASVPAELSRALAPVDCLFFDGTFWSEDEMTALGVGERRAAQMAHVPLSGRDGSVAVLAPLRAPRRLFIHINNTNPILREDSPERAHVVAAGWTVAHDGLEVVL